MSQYEIRDYTFLGICNHGKPLEDVSSLAYLVGLVGSRDHEISNPVPAKRILAWLFDEEEQAKGANQLLLSQEDFFRRYFHGGYLPQTPVMLTQAWSPIAAMLEKGLEPLILRREDRLMSVATGIWPHQNVAADISVTKAKTPQELCWGILTQVFQRARERELLISIIAQPGWNYGTKIGSLPRWTAEEVARADRILWKRTAED